jgi:hypothetical protein
VDLAALSLLLIVVEHAAGAFAEAVRVTRGCYVLVFDKFAPSDQRTSCPRRLLNLATRAVGTYITRHLDELICGQPVEILNEDHSFLGGYDQATLFRRREASS